MKKWISIFILFLVVFLSSCSITNKRTDTIVTQQIQVEFTRFDDLYNKLITRGFNVLNGDVVKFISHTGDPFDISIDPDISYKYNKVTKIMTFTSKRFFSDLSYTYNYEFLLDQGIVKYTKSLTSNTENYTLTFQYNIITEELSSFTSNFPETYQENESGNKDSMIQFILKFNNYFIRPIGGYYLHEYYVE